jgi:hypothetical protein
LKRKYFWLKSDRKTIEEITWEKYDWLKKSQRTHILAEVYGVWIHLVRTRGELLDHLYIPKTQLQKLLE